MTSAFEFQQRVYKNMIYGSVERIIYRLLRLILSIDCTQRYLNISPVAIV